MTYMPIAVFTKRTEGIVSTLSSLRRYPHRRVDPVGRNLPGIESLRPHLIGNCDLFLLWAADVTEAVVD